MSATVGELLEWLSDANPDATVEMLTPYGRWTLDAVEFDSRHTVTLWSNPSEAE